MRLLGHLLTVFAGLIMAIVLWAVTGQTGNLAVWLAAFVVAFVVVTVSLVVRRLRRPKATPTPPVYLHRPGDHRGTVYGVRRAA